MKPFILILTVICGVGLGGVWLVMKKDADPSSSESRDVLQSLHGGILLKQREPFDLERFAGFENFFDQESDYFKQTKSIIVIFNGMSCNTCVSRELEQLNLLYDVYKGEIDFLAVATPDQVRFLRQLRRVAKVRYPILIDAAGEQGQIHGTDFTIFLVDNLRAETVLIYHPHVNAPNLFDDFKRELVEIQQLPLEVK